ncbi:MAG: hypothetical protein HS100_16265 [Anaerolineales bacterium]|nr:hypothetical protein [Anaerolineales bacterium]
MKAIVTAQYGSPDILQLKEVKRSTPRDNEMLVKVHLGLGLRSLSQYRSK